jgi:hypothetical protein
MSKARDRVLAALVALLVQVILVVAGLSVCFGPESVVGVVPVPSAQGVPEPL